MLADIGMADIGMADTGIAGSGAPCHPSCVMSYNFVPADVQLVPFTQLFQTLEVRLPAGRTPDVYLVDGPLTPSYFFLIVLLTFMVPFEAIVIPLHLMELAPHNIQVNVVAPGPTETVPSASPFYLEHREVLRSIEARTPAGRIGHP